MISFIVIGRNIKDTIEICLNSIANFITVNNITNHEIIYVDSNSSDQSIQLASQFNIKIFRIDGQVNAAIGRNIGALNATGEILFFVDGDMELIPGFYEYAFDKFGKLKYPFINGYLIHKFYNSEFKFSHEIKETIETKDIYRDVTGGLMIIEKKLWAEQGGMDERLIRNQDIDFGLRMSKKGIRALLIKQLFAIHHTIQYYEKERFTSFIMSKSFLSSGILMRKHLFFRPYAKRHFQQIFICLLLLLGVIISPFNILFSSSLLLIFLATMFAKQLKTKNNNINLFIRGFILKIVFNLYTLIGLLFYFPGKKGYKINEIKQS